MPNFLQRHIQHGGTDSGETTTQSPVTSPPLDEDRDPDPRPRRVEVIWRGLPAAALSSYDLSVGHRGRHHGLTGGVLVQQRRAIRPQLSAILGVDCGGDTGMPCEIWRQGLAVQSLNRTAAQHFLGQVCRGEDHDPVVGTTSAIDIECDTLRLSLVHKKLQDKFAPVLWDKSAHKETLIMPGRASPTGRGGPFPIWAGGAGAMGPLGPFLGTIGHLQGFVIALFVFTAVIFFHMWFRAGYNWRSLIVRRRQHEKYEGGDEGMSSSSRSPTSEIAMTPPSASKEVLPESAELEQGRSGPPCPAVGSEQDSPVGNCSPVGLLDLVENASPDSSPGRVAPDEEASVFLQPRSSGPSSEQRDAGLHGQFTPAE